jgi:LPXTG-motif cell wall-anchored protein
MEALALLMRNIPLASRRVFLSLRLAILAAACCLGVAAAASGAAAALAQPNDPPGANGTVKIDGFEFDDEPSNEPHVTCPFDVQFFNFDTGQTGAVTLAAQAPSGTGIGAARSGVPLSPDAVTTTFTAGDLDLTGLDEHPRQGFHIELTVTVTKDGERVFNKHKVFWLKCAKPSPSPSPTKSPTTKPPTPGKTTPPTGVLPVTGTGIGGLAAVGLALVASGAALMVVVVRRRRDDLDISD